MFQFHRWIPLKGAFALQILGFFLFNFSVLFSQTDSTIFHLPDQTISDSILPKFQTKIDKINLKKDSTGSFGVVGLSADDALRKLPSLYVKNYGGHGGIKSISFRGFSTTQTTATIWDIPYQNTQSQTINFGNFLLESFDAISVNPQPAAGTGFGSGGNVDFSVEKPQKKQVRVFSTLGSFGETVAGVSAQMPFQNLSTRISYQQIQAKDNFPFKINGETGLRQNAGFNSQQFQGYLSYRFGNFESRYFMTGFQNVQGIPEAVVTGLPSFSKDSLTQKDIFQIFQLRYHPQKIQKPIVPHKIVFSVSTHNQQMKVKTLSNEDNYNHQQLLTQLQFYHFFAHQSFQTTFQFIQTQLKGDNLAIQFIPTSAVSRRQGNLGVQHAWIVEKKRTEKFAFRLNSGANLQWVSAIGTLWNISLSGHRGWEIFPKKKALKMENYLFFHLNRSTRLPSFNELYYFSYGNSDLLPEKIISGDMGFQLEKTTVLPFTFRFSAFANQTQNKIISIPINPVTWSTQAIGLSKTYGLEYSLEWKWTKRQEVYVNYTLQKAIDATRPEKSLLPYTPREVLNLGYKFHHQHFSFFVNGNYSGWRFHSLQNTSTTFMPAYQVWDASLSYFHKFWKIHYQITAQAHNFLHAQYAVIQSYPMPGRSFRIQVAIQF